MITLVIAIAVAFGGFSAAHYAADLGIGWSVFLGLVSGTRPLNDKPYMPS